MPTNTPDSKDTGLAVIVLQSETSENTVGHFVGIDDFDSPQISIKTDYIVARYPRDITIHGYNFNTNSWKIYQGRIIDCVQADNPGNFLLSVDIESRDHDRELFLEDSRILWIMERMEFFMGLQFFTLLPHSTIWAVLNRLDPVSFQEGDKIITQGIRGEAIYFIEQGGCYIIAEQNDEQFQQATRRKGDMMGVMALLTDEPRPANVVAATDVKLWRLGRDCFTLLVEEQFALRKFLTGLVCDRLESDGMTADLAIGKYMIDHKIGQGAWAIVYLGHHMTLGREVAIKLLEQQIALEPEFRERFLEEAKIIAKMQHRNIINIYDVENRFNMLFIIMEYLEGLPVDILLKKKGRLPAGQVIDILSQVCRGLSYAHARGIVHQDIKPDNLFMLKSGQVKILDFGLACPFGAEHIEMEGTLPYMSPEQIDSYPVDARTDLYGLGITAFQLLTGRLPHPDDDAGALREMHLHKDIPDPREFVPDLPPLLAEFIMCCCRRDPAGRYQNADKALQALQRLHQDVSEEAQQSVPQNMISLFLFHDDEQQDEVTELLEEFADKALSRGFRLKLAEFNHFL
ncbi:MAG TPA: cyclic nucleotide-binding domain-containing protein, partial [Desulfobulbaceae bacterium]|nr:cyclic nucleotide-binding domain-containing protein [Desulfobulbaceae bacterium]